MPNVFGSWPWQSVVSWTGPQNQHPSSSPFAQAFTDASGLAANARPAVDYASFDMTSLFGGLPASNGSNPLGQMPQASAADYMSMIGGAFTMNLVNSANELVNSITQSGMLNPANYTQWTPSNWGFNPASLDAMNNRSANPPEVKRSAEKASPVSGAGVKQTAAMKRLAAAGRKSAANLNSSGMCLKGVNDAMDAAGLSIQRKGHAYQAADVLARSNKYKEIKVSKKDLKKLPAGCVVIWGNQNNASGHAAITQGNGRETSDHASRMVIKPTASFRVFVPVA